jgi:hypothetical protein
MEIETGFVGSAMAALPSNPQSGGLSGTARIF